MAAEYREERNCWIYRFSHHGKKHKGYGYATRQEAEAAERKLRAELVLKPQLPKTCLQVLAFEFLKRASMMRGARRYDELKRSFGKFIIPHFGPTTLVAEITPSAQAK